MIEVHLQTFYYHAAESLQVQLWRTGDTYIIVFYSICYNYLQLLQLSWSIQCGAPHRFGKYELSLSCQGLKEKMDTILNSVW